MDIKALYELKRQSFLIGYVQNPDRFEDALAYAYEHRIAPVFHEAIMREVHGEDPFAEACSVSVDFINKVLKHIDKLWMDKNFGELGFYDLETHFGDHHEYRMELIHIIKYARISRRFDDTLYNAVEANAPAEANSINSSFSPDDVYFS
jgi:hypothetical protein